jgi:hypothetical protein
MPSAIETFLFGENGTHAVIEIGLSEKRLSLAVAPWARLDARVDVVFSQARITSVEVYADNADDLNLPWDIIGIDCRPLSDLRWEFVLHCGGIEYIYEALWPERISP